MCRTNYELIRGTTRHFKFKLVCNFSELLAAEIVFWQLDNDAMPITKSLQHCKSTDKPNEMCVTLSQAETFMFSEKRKAYVQMRAVGPTGECSGIKQQQITVYPSYSDEILDDIVFPEPVNDYIILDGENS